MTAKRSPFRTRRFGSIPALTFGALLVTLLASAVMPLPGLAAVGQPLTVVLERDATTFQPVGWYSYGLVSATGLWAPVSGAFSSNSAPIFAGTLKTAEISTVGSFSLDFQVLSSPATGDFGGQCQLSNGTGAFTGLNGTGTWAFSGDISTRYYTCSLTVK